MRFTQTLLPTSVDGEPMPDEILEYANLMTRSSREDLFDCDECRMIHEENSHHTLSDSFGRMIQRIS